MESIYRIEIEGEETKVFGYGGLGELLMELPPGSYQVFREDIDGNLQDVSTIHIHAGE